MKSYGKIFSLSKGCAFLQNKQVYVEEKIDGSRISFSVNSDKEYGVEIWSRRKEIKPKMNMSFGLAVETILDLKRINTSLVYFGEFLRKPKHNAVAYGRVPKGNIILFDIWDKNLQAWLSPEEARKEAAWMGLEFTPLLVNNINFDDIDFLELIEYHRPILEGNLIEGVVVKCNSNENEDERCLKIINPQFSEKLKNNKQKISVSTKTWFDKFLYETVTLRRIEKAAERLRDDIGQETFSISIENLGKIIPEVIQDWYDECFKDFEPILHKNLRKSIGRLVATETKERAARDA